MRQAGRYLPEYRRIRAKHDTITIYKNPKLCAEVSTLPVDILGVDAAILFGDIMLPLEGIGVEFQIKEGLGPVVSQPIRDLDAARSLKDFDPEAHVPFVLEAIRLTKGRLDGRVPLIGFSGAPFTLATYLVEGRSVRDFVNTKRLMYSERETWHTLMDKLTTAVTSYLQSQIQAGVDAIQVFDSWVGCLSAQDYRQYVLPYSQRVFKGLEHAGVPRIHFGAGTSHLLERMREAGGDVFGVDWRVPIDEAWQRLGYDVSIQGNLDPAILLADVNLLKSRTVDVLRRTANRPGHIFNLGHGMLPTAPVQNVVELVKFVHDFTAESRNSS
jgi:uroporphyrinogen decarboxylase